MVSIFFLLPGCTKTHCTNTLIHNQQKKRSRHDPVNSMTKTKKTPSRRTELKARTRQKREERGFPNLIESAITTTQPKLKAWKRQELGLVRSGVGAGCLCNMLIFSISKIRGAPTPAPRDTQTRNCGDVYAPRKQKNSIPKDRVSYAQRH